MILRRKVRTYSPEPFSRTANVDSRPNFVQKTHYFITFTHVGDVGISGLDHLKPQLDQAIGASEQFLGTGEILK